MTPIADTGRVDGGANLQLTYTILGKEDFVNTKDRFKGPTSFWSGRGMWTVLPDANHASRGSTCPVPLISGNGRFLILLQTGPTFRSDPGVMQIYRKSDSRDGAREQGLGIFVRSVGMAELAPTEMDDTIPHAWTAETPQWFAGGNLVFSEQDKVIFYRSRKGRLTRINLELQSLKSH